MHSNNGWYSVHDTSIRPENGEEVLCLGMLDDAIRDEEPLADPNNRVYYVATWHYAGDSIFNENPEPDAPDGESALLEKVYGKEDVAPEDGFYVPTPEIYHRKDTKGGLLPEYSIIFRWHRLKISGEGMDGLIAWKPLDFPIAD